MILTSKEMKIIEKKIANKRLTQSERNRLSRAIRPKLREISRINTDILNKIDYKPSINKIENSIIKSTKEEIDTDSIIIYGSAIQTNYSEYNDIDIMIVSKDKILEREKVSKIRLIKNKLIKCGIVSDIEIISRDNLLKTYKSSPTLIYQLKDKKIIYGNIKLPREIELHPVNLNLKLDWSYVDNPNNGKEIYNAIRNTLLVRLLLNRIIDNQALKEYVNNQVGKNLVNRLKNNIASSEERKIGLIHLKNLLEKTEKEVTEARWKKMQLLSH